MFYGSKFMPCLENAESLMEDSNCFLQSVFQEDFVFNEGFLDTLKSFSEGLIRLINQAIKFIISIPQRVIGLFKKIFTKEVIQKEKEDKAKIEENIKKMPAQEVNTKDNTEYKKPYIDYSGALTLLFPNAGALSKELEAHQDFSKYVFENREKIEEELEVYESDLGNSPIFKDKKWASGLKTVNDIKEYISNDTILKDETKENIKAKELYTIWSSGSVTIQPNIEKLESSCKSFSKNLEDLKKKAREGAKINHQDTIGNADDNGHISSTFSKLMKKYRNIISIVSFIEGKIADYTVKAQKQHIAIGAFVRKVYEIGNEKEDENKVYKNDIISKDYLSKVIGDKKKTMVF